MNLPASPVAGAYVSRLGMREGLTYLFAMEVWIVVWFVE